MQVLLALRTYNVFYMCNSCFSWDVINVLADVLYLTLLEHIIVQMLNPLCQDDATLNCRARLVLALVCVKNIIVQKCASNLCALVYYSANVS